MSAVSLVRPPFRILVLDSAIGPGGLVELFGTDLDPDDGFFFKASGTRAWIGSVNEKGMEIRRRTVFRNSFLPIVRARFEAHEGGTRVRVSMSLMILTRVLLGVWMLLGTVAIAGMVRTGEPILLGVPVMLLAVLAFCVVAFNLEADQAEGYLRAKLTTR